MTISGSFEAIPPEPVKIDIHEPDVPKFRFPNNERERMIKEEGMSEEEIAAAEASATAKLIANRRSQEMRAVPKEDADRRAA